MSKTLNKKNEKKLLYVLTSRYHNIFLCGFWNKFNLSKKKKKY